MDPSAPELVNHLHFGPGWSSFCVAVGTAGLLVMVVVALSRALRERRAAAQAEASFDPDAPLTPGETVVMGTVEPEQGAHMTVRVEVEQEGTESGSHDDRRCTWVETARVVRARPFYLCHASGARIRVQPGEDVMLVDEMNTMIRRDLTHRVRVAELAPGEKVFAVGELRRAPDPEAPTGGYRGTPSMGYLLVPPRGRRMLLSSEPLGARFARRVAVHMRWAAIAAVGLLVFHAALTPFHARRWFGRTVDVSVTELQHYVTKDSDGDKYDHFNVTMHDDAEGLTFSDEVSEYAFSSLRKGDRIKARYVPWWRSNIFIGPGATANAFFLVVALVFLGGAAFAYWLKALSTRPWYQSKLVELESGTLAESEPKVQAAEEDQAASRPGSG